MTTTNLNRAIESFLQNFQGDSKASKFFDSLSRMSQMFEILIVSLTMAIIKRKSEDALQGSVEKISEYTLEIKAMSPKAMFDQIKNLHEIIYALEFEQIPLFFSATDGYSADFAFTERKIEPLLFANPQNLLDSFSESYESFLQASSVDNLFYTLKAAHELHLILLTLRVSIWDVSNFLSRGQEKLRENEGEFVLQLDQAGTVSEVVAVMQSISKIYGDLCAVCGIDISEYPLRIGKLESGSLWTKFFGESKIAALMDDFFRETARYFFQNYTVDGKIQRNSNRMQGLGDDLNIIEKFKKHGIDTTDMERDLIHAGKCVMAEQATLLSNQPKVTIGETEFSKNSSFHNMISNDPLLTPSSDEGETKLLGNGPDE